MVDISGLTATVTMKMRPGLVTQFGRQFCHGLVKKIGWKNIVANRNPILLVRFLWLYAGLLGSSVDVKVNYQATSAGR